MGFETLEEYLAGFWGPRYAQKYVKPCSEIEMTLITANRDSNNLIHHLNTWLKADITSTPEQSFYADPKDGRSSNAEYRTALRSIKARALVMPGRTDLYFPVGLFCYAGTAEG